MRIQGSGFRVWGRRVIASRGGAIQPFRRGVRFLLPSRLRGGQGGGSGFSLLELAVTLVIVGLMMTGGLMFATDKIIKQQETDTQARLDEIVAAIERYYARNSRLPCVASRADVQGDSTFGKEVEIGANCQTYTTAPTGTTRVETSGGSGKWVLEGVVPVRDLLLRDELMEDGYGNRFTYAVMQDLTSSATFEGTTSDITVLDGDGNNVMIHGAYVVISHGKDGAGAYRFISGTQRIACGSTNLDTDNCDGDTTYVTAPFNNGTVAANFFDDIFFARSRKYYDGAYDPLGFRLDGVNSGSGWAVACGDINGDGYDDVVTASTTGADIFVVFGSESGIATPFLLDLLDGENGFLMNGLPSGGIKNESISLGDINGDDYDDIIIGAYTANSNTGSVYVVFGKAAGWNATETLDGTGLIDGNQGFKIDGVVAVGHAGASIATGNINNDNYDDIIIGAPNANSNLGYVYIVFGKSGTWSATARTLDANATTGVIDGTLGFQISGIAANGGVGDTLAAGDINNDNYNDIIIGASGANTAKGYTYVVFGKSGVWSATARTLDANATTGVIDGTLGFQVNGVDTNGRTGGRVGVGDINNDNFEDIFIGARDGSTGAGIAYIIFGKSGAWSATARTLDANATTGVIDGTLGFRINGVISNGYRQFFMKIGNVNYDSYKDIILGATAENGQGALYVVFGKAGAWSATARTLDANATTGVIDGLQGFKVNGISTSIYFGSSMAFGNVDGDNYDDIILGAYYANSSKGYTYGIYGKETVWSNIIYEIDELVLWDEWP